MDEEGSLADGGKDASQIAVLDFSNKGLTKMSKLPKKSPASKLILDHNNITKIENLDAFTKLLSLSMADNHLLRMNGVNFGKNLTVLNLSNNGIVVMEGLCWLVHLEHLDLSKNNIKRIQNVSYCTKLQYMDLSENSIEDISDLRSLVELETLLLHGNTITTLEKVEVNLPRQLQTLSLAGNHISDLNQVCHLSSLQNIKHFSLLNNPCVISTPSLPEIDYRPFVVSYCSTLTSLDGFAVQDSERNNGGVLRSDENLRMFDIGDHVPLVLYLSKVSGMQLQEDKQKFLQHFVEAKKSEKFTQKQNVNGRDLTLKHDNLEKRDDDDEASLGDDSGGLLRSESSFLPVYSPLKRSLEVNDRGYRPSPDQPSTLVDPVSTPQLNNEEFPIMTEEEASKLIHLAATILQAHIRGFLVRRKLDYKIFKRVRNAATKIQASWRGYHHRNVSEEGKHFRQELRLHRMQKYISTLCFMMQKSEEQHEFEKNQLLEAVHILYEKVDQLSGVVEEQNIKNTKEQYEMTHRAATVLQKHWRGYSTRKKYNAKASGNNVLNSLLNSHNNLLQKVMYLESLVSKKTTSDSEIETNVFLPHPRLQDLEVKADDNVPDEDMGLQDRESRLVMNEARANKDIMVIEGTVDTCVDNQGHSVDTSEVVVAFEHNEDDVSEENTNLVKNAEIVVKDVGMGCEEDEADTVCGDVVCGQEGVSQVTHDEHEGQLGTYGENDGHLGTYGENEEDRRTLETQHSENDLSRTTDEIGDGTNDEHKDNMDQLDTYMDKRGLDEGTGVSEDDETHEDCGDFLGNVGTIVDTDEHQVVDQEGEEETPEIAVGYSGGNEIQVNKRDILCDEQVSDPARRTNNEIEENRKQQDEVIEHDDSLELIEQDSLCDEEAPDPARRTRYEAGEHQKQLHDEVREIETTEQESVSDCSDNVDVSPRLGQRASSLLSALNTELRSVSPKTVNDTETTTLPASDNGQELSSQDALHTAAPPQITITHAPDDDQNILLQE